MNRRMGMDESGELPVTMRIVPGLFGAIFAAIGFTVIVFLWTADGFGAPPLFFRIFGSLIALAFIVGGGATAIAAILGKAPAAPRVQDPASAPRAPGGYTCPRCGAPLAADADVSPLGDVRCGHCSGWFNIHLRSPAG